MKLFVVPFEGGYFAECGLRAWIRDVRAGVPIFGVKITDRWYFLYDRILKQRGASPWRLFWHRCG